MENKGILNNELIFSKVKLKKEKYDNISTKIFIKFNDNDKNNSNNSDLISKCSTVHLSDLKSNSYFKVKIFFLFLSIID
jgi:hypothetical protein